MFSHNAEPPKIMELCKFYLFERCAKKEKCLYLHKGFPCKYYHTGMRCLDSAESCKFSHEPLTDEIRNILLKHLESAPKEILGDFPRMSREHAVQVVAKTEAKNMGWPEPVFPELPPPGPDASQSHHRGGGGVGRGGRGRGGGGGDNANFIPTGPRMGGPPRPGFGPQAGFGRGFGPNGPPPPPQQFGGGGFEGAPPAGPGPRFGRPEMGDLDRSAPPPGFGRGNNRDEVGYDGAYGGEFNDRRPSFEDKGGDKEGGGGGKGPERRRKSRWHNEGEQSAFPAPPRAPPQTPGLLPTPPMPPMPPMMPPPSHLSVAAAPTMPPSAPGLMVGGGRVLPAPTVANLEAFRGGIEKTRMGFSPRDDVERNKSPLHEDNKGKEEHPQGEGEKELQEMEGMKN